MHIHIYYIILYYIILYYIILYYIILYILYYIIILLVSLSRNHLPRTQRTLIRDCGVLLCRARSDIGSKRGRLSYWQLRVGVLHI